MASSINVHAVIIRIFLLHAISISVFAFTHHIHHHVRQLKSVTKSLSIKHPIRTRLHSTSSSDCNYSNNYRNNLDSVHSTTQDDKKRVRGAYSSSNRNRIRAIDNRILNPNNILYPSYFPYKGTNGYNANNSAQIEKVSLHRALDELRKAMERIVQFDTHVSNDNKGDDIMKYKEAIEKLEHMLGSNVSDEVMNIFENSILDENVHLTDDKNIYLHEDDNDRNKYQQGNVNGFEVQKNGDKYFTIRIEQPLSHPVDPLCWLHANAKKSESSFHGNQIIKNDNVDDWNRIDDPVVFYLANAEKTMETGVYGSSLTFRDLNLPIEDSPWDIINNLPIGSRVYGGGRFDQDLQSDLVGEEWREFGKEMWILPAVELRREQKYFDNNDESHDDEQKINCGDTETEENYQLPECNDVPTMIGTTLSVNLYFTSPGHLINSAKYVLDLLQKLSHDVSPPFPDTTLPPILSRGYNDNAQEIFEKGVNAALNLFQNDELSGEKHNSLDKVVLARRSDLHFGTVVSGLDVMMKVKFGGNIGGHLFYMNPGNYSEKEFFGCAPERLFQVRSSNRKVTMFVK